ncbi:MAG: TerB family tellurite resistance protein [Oscillatoria sp. PMC 1068.18]|nr:TerB family tellurite resistance protein [Oscillatoria sp. PMC 1076.18]MEC4987411.1 TerB family tellurite resistance protein [Oscillatoria sp. PMC 1068.18]
MPAILAFVTTFIIPSLASILASIAPVAGAVIIFTISSISKVPRYIKLIRLLYEDTEPESQARKYITLGMLLLGGILTFMVYSFVPGTALPIIGSFMTPIAAMLAVVVSLATLDVIFNLNEGYYLTTLSNTEQVDDIIADIASLSKIFGKSWKKILNLFERLLPKLEREFSKNREEFENLSDYLNRQLNGLLQYIGTQEIQAITTSEIQRNELQRQITGELKPWAKLGGSLIEGLTAGVLTGTGASTFASSIFVQAGFFTSLQGLLGLSGGIAVSASTFALLTIAAPIGLGTLATVGVSKGAIHLRNKKEKQKMSSFLGDVLIAALPMAWADGELSLKEKDTLHRMLMNPAILQQDRERVYRAIEFQTSFDEVLKTTLLLDEESRKTNNLPSEKEKIKHRLLLCVAWEIAKADGRITEEEIKLHERMAKALPTVTPEAVQEIRRLVTLESGVDLC